MELEVINMSIGVVTSLTMIGTVIFAAKQTQALRQQTGALKNELELLKASNVEAHDWNRRNVTSEMLMFLTAGEFVNVRQLIEYKYNCTKNGEGVDYTRDVASIPVDGLVELNKNLGNLLNIFETIAILVKHKIIDEAIIFNFLAVIYARYAKWADPYIKEQRTKSNPLIWVEFTQLAKEWSEMLKSLEEESVKASSVPARPMLGN